MTKSPRAIRTEPGGTDILRARSSGHYSCHVTITRGSASSICRSTSKDFKKKDETLANETADGRRQPFAGKRLAALRNLSLLQLLEGAQPLTSLVGKQWSRAFGNEVRPTQIVE
jgi:hypothetical protein